jgi:N-acetyl-gamma-glutamyl-phosphate reductase
LQIRERLRALPGIAQRSLAPEARKDVDAKMRLLAEVDLAILCLPDDAARQTAALLESMGAAAPRVIDASSAHRVAAGWTYGFPELTATQAEAIAGARKVSNPGCHATGAIALLRPLVERGLLDSKTLITITSISGYTGGGKSMIAAYENGSAPVFELYGLGLEHKHVPEIQTYSGLAVRPLFMPSVGNFAQGMLVSVPLQLDALPGGLTGRDLSLALEAHYRGRQFVKVLPLAEPGGGAERIEPESLNGTNNMELRVFANEKRRQAVLIAKLDNLGKGAAGAAVQNLRLMLGL